MHVEVRIRHANHVDSTLLAYVPMDRLDDLVRHLGKHGVYAEGSVWMGDSFDTQFVIENEQAFFEVVVGCD